MFAPLNFENRQAGKCPSLFLHLLPMIQVRQLRFKGAINLKSGILDPLVRKLSVCRQIAEHKSEMLRIRGGDKANVFKALTDGERTSLIIRGNSLSNPCLSSPELLSIAYCGAAIS